MRKMVIGLLISAMAMPVMAVDGYKNLKFGMSQKEVKDSKICKFNNVGNEGSLACEDFSFSGKKTVAMVFFIDGKFVRLGIVLKNSDQFLSVANGLREKYGEPSSPATREQITNVYELPNQKLDIGYDNDTVVLRMNSDEFNSKKYLLMYTLNNYDELSMAEENENNKNDL